MPENTLNILLSGQIDLIINGCGERKQSMSLLRDIQDAAIDPNVDVTFVLRKCKVLSARLGNEEFSKWVDQELNGYKEKESLPDYRVFSVRSKGHFAGPFGSGLKNGDIPLSCIDENYHELLEQCYCKQPISAYVDLLTSSDGGNFQEAWSPDLVARVGRDIYETMNCLSAWKVIPRGSIVTLVDAVRNRILNFVLEIESQAPDAGEAQPNNPPLPQEKVSQVFHTHIYGNVGNIAEGSQHFKQTAKISVQENDINSLKTFLSSLGIPDEKVQELENAIAEDPVTEVKDTRRLGSRVSGWLGSIISGITQGVLPIIQNVDANLITYSILSYYGIQ